jgi:hypothetical protein
VLSSRNGIYISVEPPQNSRPSVTFYGEDIDNTCIYSAFGDKMCVKCFRNICANIAVAFCTLTPATNLKKKKYTADVLLHVSAH